MRIGRGNRIRNPVAAPLSEPQIPTKPDVGSNPGHHGGKLAQGCCCPWLLFFEFFWKLGTEMAHLWIPGEGELEEISGVELTLVIRLFIIHVNCISTALFLRHKKQPCPVRDRGTAAAFACWVARAVSPIRLTILAPMQSSPSASL
jgi:hypothetical protein